jgi:hypothetical protein
MNDREIAKHELLHIMAAALTVPFLDLKYFDAEVELTQTGGRAIVFPSDAGLKRLIEVPAVTMRAMSLGPVGMLKTTEVRAIIRSARLCPGDSCISDADKALFQKYGGNLERLAPVDIDVISMSYFLARQTGLKGAIDAIVEAGSPVTLSLASWLPRSVKEQAVKVRHATFKYLRDEGSNPPDWYERRSRKLYG